MCFVKVVIFITIARCCSTGWASHTYLYSNSPNVWLRDGEAYYEGLIEIYYDNQWGYICADGFSKAEGDVVCRDLNRPPALEVYSVPYVSNEDKPIFIDNVRCEGSEDTIYDCPSNGFFNVSCNSSTIAGVKCSENYTSPWDNQGMVHLSVYIPTLDNGLSSSLYHWLGYFCDNSCERGSNQQGELFCFSPLLYDDPSEYPIAYWENNRHFTLGECTGNEAKFIRCNDETTINQCIKEMNDSVICIADEDDRVSKLWETQGFLRITGGSSVGEGLVEVSFGDGIWGSICSKFWGRGSARFVCRHLDFSGVEEFGAVERPAIYPMLRYLSCNDEHEEYWYDCLHYLTRPEKNICSSYAAVKCSNFVNEETLRLAGTSVDGEGRLEIFHDGVWGTVCRKSWSHSTLNFDNVACHQLGYPGKNSSSAVINIGLPAVGPVWLDVINCVGSEPSLLDCQHREWNENSCDHSDDIVLRCNRPESFTPRLYNGTSLNEGRIEIWEGNQWRRVCNPMIGRYEAEIICKQLGFESLAMFYNWPKFGDGVSPVLSWSINCSGNDISSPLTQCNISYKTTRNLDCNSVAVTCDDRKLTAGAIIAIVIACLAVICMLCGFILIQRAKWRKSNAASDDSNDHSNLHYENSQRSNSEQSPDPSSPNNLPSAEAPPPSYRNLFPDTGS